MRVTMKRAHARRITIAHPPPSIPVVPHRLALSRSASSRLLRMAASLARMRKLLAESASIKSAVESMADSQEAMPLCPSVRSSHDT